MTDREPDDLYDALRDRLADYGQEPPAPLWAGIRAQLPPPVATPQLRRRKRRAALLGLLLLIVSVGSWQWWHARQPTGAYQPNDVVVLHHRAANRKIHQDLTKTTPITNDNVASDNNLSSTTPVSRVETGSTTQSPASASGLAAAMPNRRASNQLLAERHVRNRKLLAMGRERDDIRKTPRIGLAKAAESAADYALVRRSKSRSIAQLEARRTAEAALRTGRAAAPAARSNDAYSTREQGMSAAKNEAFARRQDARPATASQPPITETTALAANATPATNSGRRAAATTAVNSENPAETSVGALRGLSQLLPRSVALVQQPWPGAVVQARADTVLPLPAYLAGRWAVQLLAGPALTHRLLDTGLSYADVAAPAPTLSNSPAFYDRTGARTSVPAQEQAAVGYGVQVQAERVLSGRWALSAGLGYQEYASRLALEIVPPGASFISPTTGSIRVIDSSKVRTANVRDTYRFLTVPVRVSYRLGVGGRRFHAGVLAGGEAAFYLGGATTEGSTCGCESQTWSATGSPYRSASLALSLGADLRYRLAPRWELLAQPTATYFLTSLARPASGFVPRHLLGGRALLGVSYGLH